MTSVGKFCKKYEDEKMERRKGYRLHEVPKKYRLHEVPKDVIVSVIRKWEEIERRGFDNHRDWRKCAMCFWVEEQLKNKNIDINRIDPCTCCPIFGKWCNATDRSMLYGAGKDTIREFISELKDAAEQQGEVVRP